MKKYLLLFSLLISFNSCLTNTNTLDKIKGQWFIEKITYNNLSYKDYLTSNVLIFKDNHKISIPRTIHFKIDKLSTWNLYYEKNTPKIVIKSSNLAFKDSFDIKFINDANRKLRGIVLKSDSIYIEAYKLLQNYNNW